MRLDESRPYDQVAGVPGVAFSQAGCYFDNRGDPVELRTRERSEFDEDGLEHRWTEHYVVRMPIEPSPAPSKPVPQTGTNFSAMDWKELKVMVEAYGHPWRGKNDAVAFLVGSLASDDVADQPGRHEQKNGQ